MSTYARIPVRNPAYGARAVDDETVFLSPAGDEIHSLDEVGTFIWQQIDGRRSVADILAALVAEYEVEENEARADLAAFVEELAGRKLITFA
jgi:phosphatidylserine decarboxylase